MKIVENRFLQHIIFWVVIFCTTLLLVQDSTDANRADFIYSGLVLSCLIPASYINTQLLVPRLLNIGKPIKYILAATATATIFSAGSYLYFEYLVDILLPYYFFVPLLSFGGWLLVMSFLITVTTLIYLAKSWFYTDKERRMITQIKQQKSDSELALLKAQVNPHFLFNTLNSIYALVLTKSDTAPNAIVQLSNIFRYMVYETTSGSVKLSREVEVIEDYIRLQQLRYSSSKRITFEKKGGIAEQEVAPMILFTLFENAFKHSGNDENGHFFIHSELSATNHALQLKISNSTPKKGRIKGESHGVGLEQVKQLLTYYYPKHTLTITPLGSSFSIYLEINI